MASEKKTEILYEPLWGLFFPPSTPMDKRHRQMIRGGGRWKKKDANWAGEGLFFHYKGLIKELWPNFDQHRWFDVILKSWIENEYIGVAGSKDASKSASMAVIHLADYYCFPDTTAVVISTTTLEAADNKIWSEIKMRHRQAKESHDWIPGTVIDGRRRIVTDAKTELVTGGRDYRKGCFVIPVRQGDVQSSIALIVGIKQKRKRWLLDEVQTCPSTVIDGAANFMQTGADCKVTGLGNPNDITNAHGKLCEPHESLGGWNSNIDATGKTKTWRTRWDNGICVQLPGSDSPNMDVGPEDPVPYPYLMTREQMEKDARSWTKTDWHFQMFNEGRWPRGQGASRIITRAMCIAGGALKEAKWANAKRTKLLAMDAGFGGDRCVCHELWFGDAMPDGPVADSGDSSLVNYSPPEHERKQIIAIIQTMIVPIEGSDVKDAEDQIVLWFKNQAALRGIPPSHCFCEPGMRVQLVQKFTQLWSDQVTMIDFGGKPSESMVSSDIQISCRDFYFNFVTELWYSMRLVIECGQLRQLDEETMEEGCKREYKKGVSGNKIQIEPKAEYKEKVGFSPDRFDALVTCLEGAKRLGFTIKRLRPDAPDEVENEEWKIEIEKTAEEFWKAGVLTQA